MRTLGLFNMAYGLTGMTSSVYIDRQEGVIISLWIVCAGSLLYLGLQAGLAQAVVKGALRIKSLLRFT